MLIFQEKAYTSVEELTKDLGWTELRARSILVSFTLILLINYIG